MDSDKKAIYKSFFPPLIFVAVMWVVKLVEVSAHLDFAEWGVLPREPSGLVGILTAPFVHGDFGHLVSNSIPLLVLGTMLFYFYKSLAKRVFAWIYVLSGFWLWLGGRESYHIGASGIVYGLAAFLFVSGLLRRHTGLMALSLVVVFLYGGIIWGIFPLYRVISWEAHLFGMIAGVMMAVVYRKQGPQRKRYEWEAEEDEDDDQIPEGYYDPGYYEDEGEAYGGFDEDDDPVIRYIYTPRGPKNRDT